MCREGTWMEERSKRMRSKGRRVGGSESQIVGVYIEVLGFVNPWLLPVECTMDGGRWQNGRGDGRLRSGKEKVPRRFGKSTLVGR